MSAVHIVTGTVGEYSDTIIWYVCAYDDPAAAAARVQAIQDRYAEVTKWLKQARIWFHDAAAWSGATDAERAKVRECARRLAELDPVAVSSTEADWERCQKPLDDRGAHSAPSWGVVEVQRGAP